MNFLNKRESSFPFVKEDSRDSIATPGYNPLESTGLEWNYGLVDEFIYEEYGDKEVTNAGYTIFKEVQPMFSNAFLPEGTDNATEETKDKGMTWKLFRPSLKRAIWTSINYGFLISILRAFITGSISILVYYICYQVRLVCLARHNRSTYNGL